MTDRRGSLLPRSGTWFRAWVRAGGLAASRSGGQSHTRVRLMPWLLQTGQQQFQFIDEVQLTLEK
jgi:hypothetical protein